MSEEISLKLDEDKKLERTPIFNPDGSDEVDDRRVVGAQTTNFLNLAQIKYPWAITIYNIMLQNFWIPERLNASQDKTSYLELTPLERSLYNDVLASLTWLDSSQTNNLPNLMSFVTAPELKMVLAIQIFQEALHTKAYNNLVHSIIPKDVFNSGAFFRNWEKEKNETLFARNSFFQKIFQKFTDSQKNSDFFRVLLANYCLEGISFTIGFRVFYDFKFSLNKMDGTVENVKTIHRDEDSHCAFFSKMIEAFVYENGWLLSKEEIKEIFFTACSLEKQYISSLFEMNDEGKGTRLSLTKEKCHACLEFITDRRMLDLGFEPIFNTETEDQLSYLNKISGLVPGAPIKENFFEGKVTQYQMASVIDWDI